MLTIGSAAPEFSAFDQSGQKHDLVDYQGRWLLLYFYPKDDTPGCTTEACTLRDSFSEFKKSGAAILGVSGDSVVSHAKFAAKYNLSFPLLADTNKTIAHAYQATGLLKRISYLIDPQGKIARAYSSVRPAEHAVEVLNDLASLNKN